MQIVINDVEFSEEEAYKAEMQKRAAPLEAKERSKLADIPIRLGLAKDETGANIVLVAVGIFAVLSALLVFFIAS